MTVYYCIGDELKPLDRLTGREATTLLTELSRAAQHASPGTNCEITELAKQLAHHRDSLTGQSEPTSPEPDAETEDRCRDPFDENCRAPLDDGEGWNGACGSCADRLDNENSDDNP